MGYYLTLTILIVYVHEITGYIQLVLNEAVPKSNESELSLLLLSRRHFLTLTGSFQSLVLLKSEHYKV